MKTRRTIKKAKHTSFRMPGAVLEIVKKHQRTTGLPASVVICDLIKYADSVQLSQERMSGDLDKTTKKAGAK